MSDKVDKIDLKDFCLVGFQYVLQPQELDLSVIDPDKLITDEQTRKIMQRLPFFKAMSFCDMIYQYCRHNKLPYDDTKIFEYQGYAIGNNLRSLCSYTEEQIETFFEDLRTYGQGTYMFYDNLLLEIKDDKVTFGLSMCKEFADHFEKDIESENNRMRNYIIFDMAQQIYTHTAELFESILKQFELV